jgi:hypothetical protein
MMVAQLNNMLTNTTYTTHLDHRFLLIYSCSSVHLAAKFMIKVELVQYVYAYSCIELFLFGLVTNNLINSVFYLLLKELFWHYSADFDVSRYKNKVYLQDFLQSFIILRVYKKLITKPIL